MPRPTCPKHRVELERGEFCGACEAEVSEREDAGFDVDGWHAGQDAYERWLDRIGP